MTNFILPNQAMQQPDLFSVPRKGFGNSPLQPINFHQKPKSYQELPSINSTPQFNSVGYKQTSQFKGPPAHALQH